MTLRPLTPLPTLQSPQALLEIGGGGFGGGPVATPPTFGGPSYGNDFQINPIVFDPTQGKATPPKDTASDKGVLGGQAASLLQCLYSPGSCLLRLVFLVLGLIAVIGAIYLYKPSWVLTPAKAGAKALAES